MLRVNKVSKFFQKEPILKEINLKLKKGEVLAICGAVGSGKSTLLKIIAGLLDVDGGEVFLNNEQITGPSQNLVAGDKSISYLDQHFALSPNRTVAENIGLLLLHLPEGEKQLKISYLLDLCKLTLLAERMPNGLSGGERQRLALARALAKEPKLLLFDEPFSHLDPITKNDMRILVGKIIRKKRIATIWVTHDAQEALGFANSVALLQNGVILEKAKPEDIYLRPQNIYTARFFGKINFLKTTFLAALSPQMIGKYGLRPEKLFLSTSGKILATVKDQIYLGAYYEIYAVTEHGQKLIFHSSHSLTKNSQVALDFDRNDLIRF